MSWHGLLCSDWPDWLCLWTVRLRQEEKRQQEESSKVKERKRKREKYAERVSAHIEGIRNLLSKWC